MGSSTWQNVRRRTGWFPISAQSFGIIRKSKDVAFQLWALAVNEDNTAFLTCREDSDMPVIYEQKYEYTDFPVGTWKMYLIDGVLMVPSEY